MAPKGPKKQYAAQAAQALQKRLKQYAPRIKAYEKFLKMDYKYIEKLLAEDE